MTWLIVVASAAARVAGAQHAIDSSFAGLVARLSEPNGYFDSDNIITNEASYLQIASQLRKTGTHGGVYVGVGPDQNFSYIALIRPRVAFMLDIRRDNLLEHLLFKSYFTVARNRAEYLCLLLGKPVPSDIERWSSRSAAEILAYVNQTRTDSAAVIAARKASNARIASFGVPLDARDLEMIDRYRAEFVASGLETRYSSLGRNNRMDYPSFGQLILATDREGRRPGYLADENSYQLVRDMELHDRIVPVVGNVAGDKAVRAIGEYASEHHLVVSAFYLSNVEQYLMTRQGGFPEFARNVKTLPRDSTSVIIRSYFGRLGTTHPLYVPASGNLSTSMIEPIDSFLRRYAAGEIHTYFDLVFNGFVSP
ncbi:MAG TPA: hypothetical protein VN706_15050 [Gemmatimonadaceae bacterium]|nr:hypothetical protein [Gemmatimonadaceae bacterium]